LRFAVPMPRIVITRHGESEHNLNTQLFMGRSPTSRLTGRGREQAQALGRRLAVHGAPTRVICSSLPRARETAELIVSALRPAPPIEGDDAFWELSKGDWEGRMPRTLPPDIQAELSADPYGYRHPGGESYRDVEARVGPAFDRWVARHPGDTLLFVLHGDVIRALLHHLIGFPPARIGDWAIDPCSLSEVFQDGDGRCVILRLNDTSHLG
jgi:broad specificity phosphatase PhoE